MVRVILLAMLWLTGSAALGSEYRLWLSVSPSGSGVVQAELGMPLTVWLHYQGPADLDRIRTDPWEREFFVDRGYAKRQANTQQLRLRVTPRRTGELDLPALRLGGAQSQPLRVQAEPAREAGQQLTPTWRVSHSQAWQGEEIRAVLALTIPRAARLTVVPPVMTDARVDALPPRVRRLDDQRVEYHFAWLLRPRAAGQTVINAPVLRYLHEGVPRRRFHFPDHRVNVRALPAYVTPTVPIGALSGGQNGAPIIAIGVPAPQLLAALQRTGLQGSVAATRDGNTGTHSQARVHGGWSEQQPQGLVYFDPTAGRLRALHPTSPAAPWPVWLSAGVAIMIGGVWLFSARHRLIRRWQLLHYRRRLTRRLWQAADARAAIAALLEEPLPGASQAPRTLGDWLTGYAAAGARPPATSRTAVQALMHAGYGFGSWDRTRSHNLAKTL